MRVSTIIPTLNEASNIRKTVDCVIAAGADEVIICDGGSADETTEIANQAGCRVVGSSAGRGIQLNAGARAADGEVLFFLHADTWPAESSVAQIREAMSDVHVQGGAFRQRIEAEGHRYRWLEYGNAWRAKWRSLPYGDQGIFLRRTFFDDLGGFPEVQLMEDLMLMRMFRRRSKPVLLPGPLHVNARRWQKHGVIRQTLKNWSLVTAFQFGVSPNRLADFYRRHDQT